VKIAVASSGLGHVKRGVESWALAIAEGLAREGEDVTLFGNWERVACRVSGVGNGRSAKMALGGVRRSSTVAKMLARVMPGFTWRWGWKSAYGWEQLFFYKRMEPYLERRRFDVLHLQDPMVALWAQRSFGAHGAHVILAHGTEEDMSFLKRMVHVQELSPHYHRRHAGIVAPRTRHCIPNFVDTEVFRPANRAECREAIGLPRDGVIVLSVGAINRHRKRMDHLFSEFAMCSLAGASLVIAGACDSEGAALVREGKQLLGERLHVIQNLSHEAMPKVYGAADLFVLCAHEEIFGIAFLEAMASGIACIGHTYPVTEWIIGDGGSCVDMLGAGVLAKELDLYANSSLREQRGARARERVEKVFSWKAVYPQTMEMYRAIAASC